MAFIPYHNITGSTGVDVALINPGEEIKVKSILITNTHESADATVSLFIQDQPSSAAFQTYYILSTIAIPSNTSLLLDNSSMLKFDNSTDGYGLFITVGSTDTVDVMINQ
tara:strand:+ start:834 stop:1163 length:330 start_codon:yes stop_codon:yes gene_type:complete